MKQIIINKQFPFSIKENCEIPIIQGLITQKYIDWARRKTFYLATMPRSGTNFLNYFFNYFNMALLNTLDYNDPIPNQTVTGAWDANLKDSLEFKWFLISHNYCPGFDSLCGGEFRKKWNSLGIQGYEHNDINYIFLLEKFKNILYPHLNKDVKIIFLYRNPLDQIISLSNHFKKHISPPENAALEDKQSFTMYIDSYIKMYLSYDYMKNNYPDNIKFIKYEKLVANPKNIIEDILKYYDFDLSIDNRMELFEKTLELVTPKALRKLELKMGKTLAGDQKLSSTKESHMRGGKTGNWKEFFSEDELYMIEKRFNEFNLTLNQFDGIEYEFNKEKLNSLNINKIIIEERESNDSLKNRVQDLSKLEKTNSNIKLIKSIDKYNIIQVDKDFIAVQQSLGDIDFNKDRLATRELIPYIFVSDSLKGVENKLKKNRKIFTLSCLFYRYF